MTQEQEYTKSWVTVENGAAINLGLPTEPHHTILLQMSYVPREEWLSIVGLIAQAPALLSERDRLKEINSFLRQDKKKLLAALRLVWGVFNIDLCKGTNTEAGKCYNKLAPIITKAEKEEGT